MLLSTFQFFQLVSALISNGCFTLRVLASSFMVGYSRKGRIYQTFFTPNGVEYQYGANNHLPLLVLSIKVQLVHGVHVMIEAQIWKHMMTMMKTMPIMILMMMSKSENIFLVKKTFLYVVKMLKYSPIWSPCEVQEPNFNLQL